MLNTDHCPLRFLQAQHNELNEICAVLMNLTLVKYSLKKQTGQLATAVLLWVIQLIITGTAEKKRLQEKKLRVKC